MENLEIERLKEIAEKREKQLKRQNEYIKNNFDRLSITAPKGTKEKIKDLGFSINEYINMLIEKDLENRENTGK